MNLGDIVAWLTTVGVDISNTVKEHLTTQQAYGIAAVLAIITVISILKKVIFLAVLALIAGGAVIAYHHGAFNGLVGGS